MEQNTKKKILIICYSFPPYPGIGGRRWAKFAKYFAQQNVECHVINATNHNAAESEWTKDVKSPNIIVHSVPFRFKYLMTYASNSLLYRVQAKLLNMWINTTKHSPYFFSTFSKNQLLKKCAEIIEKENIKTVIVSGDPYTFLYASELKERFGAKLVFDYRDLWNDHAQYNGHYHVLTPKQRAYFQSCENEAVNKADLIVGVYEIIMDKIKKRVTNPNTRFAHISNGFDTDDYKAAGSGVRQSKKVKIYMGGSLAIGAQEIFLDFLKAFDQLKKQDRALWENFEIEIDGSFPTALLNEVTAMNNEGILIKKGNVANCEYVRKLDTADYGALVHVETYKNAKFITKTYDYFRMKKAIIVLGPRGTVAEFAEKNNIGFGFNPEEEKDVVAFFKKLKDKLPTLAYSKEFVEELDRDYNVKNLAATYLHEIA